jgi:G3E family GTPase
MKSSGQNVEIRNIPGGCLCCSSMPALDQAFAKLLERPDLRRIFVEPSGLAIMPDLVAYLRRTYTELGLHPGRIIALLNPKRIKESHYKSLPFFTTLIDHADILVANRTDQCTERELAHFREWTARLQPEKRAIVETTFGKISPALLAENGPECQPPDEANTRFYLPHQHSEHSGGFRLEELTPVCEKRFAACLREWAANGLNGTRMLRFKALLPTTTGWRLFEIAEDTVQVRPVQTSDAARLDWIGSAEISKIVVMKALHDHHAT